MDDREDAGVHAVHAPRRHALARRVGCEAARDELAQREDRVLPSRELGDRDVRRGVLLISRLTQAGFSQGPSTIAMLAKRT